MSDSYSYMDYSPFAEAENRDHLPVNISMKGKWAFKANGIRYVGECMTTFESTRGVKLVLRFGNKKALSVPKASCQPAAEGEEVSAAGPP
ncbi:hypothetical protein PsYK624_028670 [Phanerochaete sordida]|uniref:Uncharacterized protein n=1 Tax=Phanerochaete sordida TaxID=48140 RepID=A0A9P3L9Q7_9APHY|nr:hypothetical protein PsYK624_028670 [Phanerochaete sordida]